MTQHYFSETPSSDFRPREIEAVLANAPRSVLTAGGVFSPDGLDRGTAVLLRELPALAEADPPSGPLLDVGCGWGPIALAAALEHPDREVWAIDVNERSRDLTRENAARLGLGNVRVGAPEEVPTELGFAEIRSNPPIRVGKQALHGILREWLPRLLPGGAAYLVVAKHLGADSLQRWIATEFSELSVDRAARDKGFHVIRARRS
ncbi:MAG: class I SAM-dependent methyltransferase [Leucobacter sp.]